MKSVNGGRGIGLAAALRQSRSFNFGRRTKIIFASQKIEAALNRRPHFSSHISVTTPITLWRFEDEDFFALYDGRALPCCLELGGAGWLGL
jgi:hypothetical protein